MSDFIDWNEEPAIDWTEEDDFEYTAGPSHRDQAEITAPPLLPPVKSLPDSYTQYEGEVDPDELRAEAKAEARKILEMVRGFSFQECRMPTIPESQGDSGHTTPRAEHINWFRRKMEEGQITPTGRSSPVQDLEGQSTEGGERAWDQSQSGEERPPVFDSDEEDGYLDWSTPTYNEGPARRSMSLDLHNKDFAAQFAPNQASTSRQPLNRHSVHSVPGSSEMTYTYTEPLPKTDKTDDERDIPYRRGSRPSPD